MSTPKNIRKASGLLETFDIGKLKNSLMRAGASDILASDIASDIERWLPEGISSKKIYDKAFSLLRNRSRSNASRYRLKQAILELGPSGHPFEQLTGEIFAALGYKVEVAVVAEGRCITHEMDVIATNSNEQILVECKFAHDQGKHVGIQVPLYVNSRVADIAAHRSTLDAYRHLKFKGCVVTNTRFSGDSSAYAVCSGIKLLAWDYPAGNGLKDLLERFKIMPITILKNLTNSQKNRLLERGLVTCRQLSLKPDALEEFSLPNSKVSVILKELEQVLL